MKNKDKIIILAVAIVSAIFSYTISSALFGGDKQYTLTAPKVEPISAEFVTPSDVYYNPNALNPTKIIIIGDSTNTQPL